MKRMGKLTLCVVLLLCALLLCAYGGGNGSGNGGGGGLFGGGGSAIGDGSGEGDGSKGLTYRYDQQYRGYFVTGMGTCTDTRLVIPSTYNGVPVVGIEDGAFRVGTSANGGTGGGKEEGKKDGKLSLGGLTSLLSTVRLAEESTVFRTSAITSVVIPDSVFHVGEEAFRGCESLATLEATSMLSLIGTDAFRETAYYTNPDNWENGVLYLGNYLVEVVSDYSGTLTIREGTVQVADSAAKGCVGITAIKFPSTLRVVGSQAFAGCTGLTEVDLRVRGISVGSQAFAGCTGVTSIAIGTDDVPNVSVNDSFVGDKAFGFGNAEDNEVYMPKAMSVIRFNQSASDIDLNAIYASVVGFAAFEGCTSLTDIWMGKGVQYIDNCVFRNCTSLVSVDLSHLVAVDENTPVCAPNVTHYRSMDLAFTFENCTSLVDVRLPQGITYLTGTFTGCDSLATFTLPDTVRGLDSTFRDCYALAEMTVPEGVVALSSTFRNCYALEKVTLPSTLERVGTNTFSYCHQLSVTLPDSVTEIGMFAFRHNRGTVISVGPNVKSIGQRAFFWNAVEFRGTTAQWNAIEKHEEWMFFEERNAIYCTDGVVGVHDGKTYETVPPAATPMRIALREDGAGCAEFLGITVVFDGGYKRGQVDLSDISFDELTADPAYTPIGAHAYYVQNDMMYYYIVETCTDARLDALGVDAYVPPPPPEGMDALRDRMQGVRFVKDGETLIYAAWYDNYNAPVLINEKGEVSAVDMTYGEFLDQLKTGALGVNEWDGLEGIKGFSIFDDDTMRAIAAIVGFEES